MKVWNVYLIIGLLQQACRPPIQWFLLSAGTSRAYWVLSCLFDCSCLNSSSLHISLLYHLISTLLSSLTSWPHFPLLLCIFWLSSRPLYLYMQHLGYPGWRAWLTALTLILEVWYDLICRDLIWFVVTFFDLSRYNLICLDDSLHVGPSFNLFSLNPNVGSPWSHTRVSPLEIFFGGRLRWYFPELSIPLYSTA